LWNTRNEIPKYLPRHDRLEGVNPDDAHNNPQIVRLAALTSYPHAGVAILSWRDQFTDISGPAIYDLLDIEMFKIRDEWLDGVKYVGEDNKSTSPLSMSEFATTLLKTKPPSLSLVVALLDILHAETTFKRIIVSAHYYYGDAVSKIAAMYAVLPALKQLPNPHNLLTNLKADVENQPLFVPSTSSE
jgi:hypothetical protein